ncbi:MAG TPA: hypothetical protein VMV31_01335 [Terriglobales bacterium]|nr:hypothetical protein [Terriglobales bacterium]
MARGEGALGAGAGAGYRASGTATLTLPGGTTQSGAITVTAWGFRHCRVAIAFSSPWRRGRYEAVASGAGLHIVGPEAWSELPPLAGGARGCALLAQALDWTQAQPEAGGAVGLGRRTALRLDPASGLPVSAAWRWQGQAVELDYSGYEQAGGVSYAARITERVGGAARLAIRFTSFAPRLGLGAADFVVPPPPPAAHAARGGAQ